METVISKDKKEIFTGILDTIANFIPEKSNKKMSILVEGHELSLIGMDDAQTVYFTFKFSEAFFEEHSNWSNIQIGASPSDLKSILNLFKNESIHVELSEERIKLSDEAKDKNLELFAFEKQYYIQKIDNSQFYFTLPKQVFLDSIRVANIYGDYLSISINNDANLIFKTEGPKGNAFIKTVNPKITNGEIIALENLYSCNSLIKVEPLLALKDTVSLGITNQGPLQFIFDDLGVSGKILFATYTS